MSTNPRPSSRADEPAEFERAQAAPPNRVSRRAFLGSVSPESYSVAVTNAAASEPPRISAIVPTRNRCDLLADTIDALIGQDLAPHEFEIIIVDNASDDETLSLLERRARRSLTHVVGVRMHRDCGPAVARNVGITLASGGVVAFTDSDCIPTSGWLRACLAGCSGGVGVVQGRTAACPDQRQPLFNHFIETPRFDGTFSTSNVAYLRAALVDAGGFDKDCAYWEDADLGWRTRGLGWRSAFSPEALVYHQVLPRSGFQWLVQPRHFHSWPAKAARYPECRHHLFLGIWSHRAHAIFQLFLVGLLLGRIHKALWLFTLPYLVTFPSRGRLVGRFPVLRAIAHVARDAVATAALITGSVRYRSVVL